MTLSIRSAEKFAALPAAVLLDLDNTLYPYEASHRSALKQVREKCEGLLAIAPQNFDSLFSQARTEVKARLGRTAASHSRLLYFQRLIELAGLKTQVLTALDLEQTYWRSFLAHAHLFDDVVEFLDDMRQLATPIVIVTDLTAQIQFRKLIHFGLDHYVNYVVTSEEAGADKPARAPFELALNKIGVIAGSIWMIGDDDCDVSGPAAVGSIISIQKVSRSTGHPANLADATFETFADLRALVAKLNRQTA